MNDDDDKIFNNDPIVMKNLIGKKVQLKTIENVFHTGVVYVIDPIYKTVVLHTNKTSEEQYDTTFLFHHAIESLEILSDEIEEGYLNTSEPVESSNDNEERKALLKKWLEHMYINVSESGEYLRIDDHLLIVPPYGQDNCISNNTIILERVQKIMSLMPTDFKPDK